MENWIRGNGKSTEIEKKVGKDGIENKKHGINEQK